MEALGTGQCLCHRIARWHPKHHGHQPTARHRVENCVAHATWCVVILHVEPEKATFFWFSLLENKKAATLLLSNPELLSLTHTGLSWSQWALLVALRTWGCDASPRALMQPRNYCPFSLQTSAIFGESSNKIK